ncbi:MAG: hypothetical protein ACT4P7_11250 [Gemmatimonadaceae bacterium]
MPRIVDISFDINGATSGTQIVSCDPGAPTTGQLTAFLAWDRREVRSARQVRASIKLLRPGLISGRVLIRDKTTASAADPEVPDFVFPGLLEFVGPTLGWKVTSLLTTYTYECVCSSSSGTSSLNITSSRGGQWVTEFDSPGQETIRGVISLRDAGERYEREFDTVITAACETPVVDDDGIPWYAPEQPTYETAIDRKLGALFALESARTETRIAEALAAIIAAYGPPNAAPGVNRPTRKDLRK